MYTTLCKMQQIYYIHNVVQMQLISYIHNNTTSADGDTRRTKNVTAFGGITERKKLYVNCMPRFRSTG